MELPAHDPSTDEVAAFIHDTKGGKYSALLPLLGLHEMEVAARTFGS